MTPPRDSRGPLCQAHRARTAAAARHLARQARRAADQLAAAATTAPAIVGQTAVNPRHHLTFS